MGTIFIGPDAFERFAEHDFAEMWQRNWATCATVNEGDYTMPSSEVMTKFAKGKLHSGTKSGPVVTSAKQAIAIAASERAAEAEHGGKYPEAPKSKRGKDSR